MGKRRSTKSTYKSRSNVNVQEDVVYTPRKSRRNAQAQRNLEEPEIDLPTEIEVIEKLSIDEEEQEILVDDIEMETEDFLDTNSAIFKSDVTPDSSFKNSPKSKARLVSISKRSLKRKDGAKGEEEVSDEERWLDAIESGKLEEVDDELKRMKNPLLMTARQRALLEKRSVDVVEEDGPVIPPEPLMALPSGFKERVETEEMLQKKALKSKRRREQAIEKREEDKKKTVDRLLKKQDPKISRGGSSKSKTNKKDVPLVSYVDNQKGMFLSFPEGLELPYIQSQVASDPPKPKICALRGCFNIKKYNCSKTNVPLCSLECYRKNLEFHKVVPMAS